MPTREEKIAFIQAQSQKKPGPSREEKIAFIQSKQAEGGTPKASILETINEGVGRGASLGFLPQLQAIDEMGSNYLGDLKDRALETLGLDELMSLDAQLRKKGFKLPEATYVAVRDENIKRQAKQSRDNPITAGLSNLAGGVVSGIATGGLLPQAAVGSKLAKAAAQGALTGGVYGFASNPGDAEGEVNPLQISERLGNAGIGVATGGVIGAGLPLTAESIRAVAQKLRIPLKEAAARIQASAQRLNVKPTAGMLRDSHFLQTQEQSLEQAPTLAGVLMRRETRPLVQGLQKASKDILDDQSSLSPAEAGDLAKRQISEKTAEKFKPSIDAFEDLSQYTKDIPVSERSVEAVSRNILGIPEIKILELPIGRQIVNALKKNPTLDEIKILRGLVGAELETAEGAAARGYAELYQKMTRLEESTLKRGVLNAARNSREGEKIASDMLGQMRGAKKSYSTELGNIRGIADDARLGRIHNPKSFNAKVDKLPSEQMQDKFLNLANTRLNESMKEHFPEAFETLRGAKLGSLAKSSEKGGEVVTAKLLSNTKKYSPEASRMMFGDKASKLSDVRLLHETAPELVGKSGTAQEQGLWGVLNPVNNIRDLARYAAYKGLSSDKLQAVLKAVAGNKQLQALAEKNPKEASAAVLSFIDKMQTEAPLKVASRDVSNQKWASEGLEKLREHGGEFSETILENPKAKDLLIQASDLKPGSEAMENLKKKLEKFSQTHNDTIAIHWARANPDDPRSASILEMNGLNTPSRLARKK